MPTLDFGPVKTFHCTHCQNLVFFENVRCLACGYSLAYAPAAAKMIALEETSPSAWHAAGTQETYRLCLNYSQHGVCNWALKADDRESLCVSCQYTRVIPDLNQPGNKVAWYKLEVAKRRLLYTLFALGLPLQSKQLDARSGLAFELLQDSNDGDRSRVLTGHDNGLITINIAEADDLKREQQRVQQHEPYRTLLGHFRHEIGHFYWDRLVLGTPLQLRFRELFGDERQDYAEALQRHYQQGPTDGWPEHFISAYATSHPWEDWAESWAHYLHMVDALETAGSAGLTLKPRRCNEPALDKVENPLQSRRIPFDSVVEAWVPLTYLLNNLNRGLGLADAYPYVLTPAIFEKLQFIHEVVSNASTTQ